jgi:hypothetical protein
MLRQQAGGDFSHVSDPQGADELSKPHRFPAFYGRKDIAGRFLTPAVKTSQFLRIESKKIRQIANKSLPHQLFDVFLSQSFQIQPALAGKIDQFLQMLGWTGRIDAADNRFLDGLHKGLAAFRTFGGKNNRFFLTRSHFRDNLDNLRNDVAGSLDEYRVVYAQAFPLNLIPVVKGCPPDHRTIDFDRPQMGNRCHCSQSGRPETQPPQPPLWPERREISRQQPSVEPWLLPLTVAAIADRQP